MSERGIFEAVNLGGWGAPTRHGTDLLNLIGGKDVRLSDDDWDDPQTLDATVNADALDAEDL